jgi:predicted RNase H-like HicB family nuclease
MKPVQVSFRLQFNTRRDDEADVYVGYCPALKLYSQGTTEEEAEEAVVSAVKLFLVACYERDILHSALRNRGMTRATAIAADQIKKDENKEFISVHQFDREFWRDVPINLVAAQEAAETCLQ